MDAESGARAWREAWLRGWPTKDVDAIAAVYADGAAFRSQPFRELQSPADYARWAFAEQDEARCWFGEPIVAGDRAAVEYWAIVSFRGRHETIAGVAVLRFDENGRVSEQRDSWNVRDGAHEPRPGWGR